MRNVNASKCEVKVDGTWLAVSPTKAQGRYTNAPKRCPVCFGQVVVTGSYTAEREVRTIAHRRQHTGCPLLPKVYCGIPSPHPDALA